MFIYIILHTDCENVKCVFMVGLLGCDLRTFQDRKGCDLDFLARTKIFLCGFWQNWKLIYIYKHTSITI